MTEIWCIRQETWTKSLKREDRLARQKNAKRGQGLIYKDAYFKSPVAPISPQAEEMSSESRIFITIAISKRARLKEFRVSLPQWEHQVKCEISREGKRITYFLPRENNAHWQTDKTAALWSY